jgi:hypothetical protein
LEGALTVGLILLVIGAIEIAWMVWRIRTYEPDANRTTVFEAVMHDVLRTTARPKSRFIMMIDRYSSWYGLLVGLLIVGLGLVFTLTE